MANEATRKVTPEQDAGYGEAIDDANKDMDKPAPTKPYVSNENNERVATTAQAKQGGEQAMAEQQAQAQTLLDRFMDKFRRN